MQVIIAVMRKLLHAIGGMLKHDETSTVTSSSACSPRSLD
jgi:hypothetical protein